MNCKVLKLTLVVLFSWISETVADYTSTEIVHRDGAIPVVLICDDNYIQPCATTIISVSKNSKRTFDFYILDCGIADKNVQKIKNWDLGKDKIFFVKVDVVPAFFNRKDNCPVSELSRLLIQEIFPNLDKGIYMDCDMVCTGDLGLAWDIDISDKYFGVVQDEFHHDDLKKLLSIPPENFYFNAGFMLMNLALLREFKLSEKAIRYLEQHKALSFADQDCLNVLFSDRTQILELGYRFNGTYKTRGNPIILHYTFKKPWKLPINFVKYFPFRFREWCIEYYRYLALTPFADEAKTNGSWKFAIFDVLWKSFEQPIENFIRNIKTYFRTFGEPR